MRTLTIQEIHTSPEFLVRKIKAIRESLNRLKQDRLMVKDVDSEKYKSPEPPEEDKYKRNTPYLKEVEQESEQLEETKRIWQPFVSNRAKRLVSTPIDFIINFDLDEEEQESWGSESIM